MDKDKEGDIKLSKEGKEFLTKVMDAMSKITEILIQREEKIKKMDLEMEESVKTHVGDIRRLEEQVHDLLNIEENDENDDQASTPEELTPIGLDKNSIQGHVPELVSEPVGDQKQDIVDVKQDLEKIDQLVEKSTQTEDERKEDDLSTPRNFIQGNPEISDL